MSIASGSLYAFLNQTQCKLTFTPTRFNLTVSVGNRIISVVPQDDGDAVDVEPRGVLGEWALRHLVSFTEIETKLYVSAMGESFISNAINKLNNSTVKPQKPLDNVVLPAFEHSIEAAMNDILVALDGVALTQPGNHETTTATFHVNVALIGSAKYFYPLLVINTVALPAISILTLLTKDVQNRSCV